MAPRREDGAANRTDLTPLSRVVAGARAVWDGWFGPGQPLTPMAPREQVEGRQFDYPFAVNLNYAKPKAEASESGIGFPMLRALAEPGSGGLDVLRLAIETRKDQMSAQRWAINPRLEDKNQKATPEQLKRARALEQVLRRPDGEHTWQAWLRMLLEDHFVLDAVAVLPRIQSGRPLFELMDAATVKRLIDEKGRTPLPPLPAFQQVLKGMPAIDYRSDELRYFVHNPRTNRMYGLSHVEQVINTVNVALRRFLHVQQYYTEGTVPDALMQVPEGWNTKQIREFQDYWDALLEGNTGGRRKMRFVPSGANPTMLKPDVLKDEFDEWLARVVCYCFSLPHQALVKEVNRATAETAQESGLQEGLEPIKIFVKEVIDDLLERSFGAGDYEITWVDEEITDPKVKAEVTRLLVGSKPVIDQNEARGMWGYADKTPEELEAMEPLAPPDPFGGLFGAAPARRALPPGEKRDDDDDVDKAARRRRGRALHGYAKPPGG